ncbi:MAG: flagellar protein FlgN [Thermoguttaceae bacterium]|nr:flagellar protein FlgN [Thermoguttaceae bacterium]MDW8079445.1 flagellar export chaperone FlgN [Thermoguttaceae bacterium]
MVLVALMSESFVATAVDGCGVLDQVGIGLVNGKVQAAMDPLSTDTASGQNGREPEPLRWEHRIGQFLAEVSELQEKCLAVLKEKQAAIARLEMEKLTELQAQTLALTQQLEQCQRHREELLAEARAAGYSVQSLRQLLQELPASQLELARRRQLELRVQQSAWHWRLLEHQALANWLLLQRTLLHLSQLLEIIATGGQPVPTYCIGPRGDSLADSASGGNLVDQRV